MNAIFTHFLAALFLLATGGMVWADSIYLSNGKKIEGNVRELSDGRYRIEMGGSVFTVEPSMVDRVEKGPEWENTLLRIRDSFRAGEVSRAFNQIALANREGAPHEELNKLIDQHDLSIRRELRHPSPRELSDLRISLSNFRHEDFLSTPSLFLMAQYLAELEAWDEAAEALDQVGLESLQDDYRQREWALRFLRIHVRRHLSRGEFEKALARIEEMRLLTPNADSAQLPLAHLAAAAEARDNHNFRSAFRLIALELYPAVPEIARNRAIFAIDRLKEYARETGNYEETRKALSPLRSIFPVEFVAARNEILEADSRHLLERGEPDKALNLIESIPPGERIDNLNKLYNLAYFQARERSIGESDPLALLELGKWALENGLLKEAILVLNRTRLNPNLRDTSEQLLANANMKRDIQKLEEAQELFDRGQMVAVLDITNDIVMNPGRRSEVHEKAEKLAELARSAMAAEQERLPYQAEVFFQQAERAYFQGNPRESLSLLRLILREFRETPAAKRATELLPDVIRNLEIQFLEGKISEMPDLGDEVTIEQFQKADKLSQEVSELLDAMQDSESSSLPRRAARTSRGSVLN